MVQRERGGQEKGKERIKKEATEGTKRRMASEK